MNYSESIKEKLVEWPLLKKMLAVWRFKNQKIVFTNGCFDLIHQGHIHLLTTAGSFGDVLIVGLNTDASIATMKPGRPIQDQHSRSLIMASFAFVDAVILFDEETPYELIEKIQPNVLVKGGDYKPEDVVGKEYVEKHGGKVELVNYAEGFSTTNMLLKITGDL